MKTSGIDRIAALVIAVAWSWPGPALAAPTVEQVRQAIADQRDRVRSMQGVFTTATSPDAQASESSQMRGVSQKIRIKFAWSGAKRLIVEEGDWITSDMSKAQVASTNVFDGKEFRRRTGKDFLIQGTNSAFSEINVYLYDLRWPTSEADLAEVRSDASNTKFLPHCLDSKDWTIRPGEEPVDAVNCVVAERKSKGWRLYLDPKRQFALVRAEYDRPAKGFIRSVYSYGKYREVAPGFHFPMEIASEVATEDGGKPAGTLTTLVSVEELRVNDVPDSAFVLEPSPGDYVIDRVRNQIYNYTVEDNNTLDVVSEKASLDLQQTNRSRIRGIFAFGLSGFAAGLLLILLFIRLGGRTHRGASST